MNKLKFDRINQSEEEQVSEFVTRVSKLKLIGQS
jgi:hypothetical protein